jgi:hypothetical protein
MPAQGRDHPHNYLEEEFPRVLILNKKIIRPILNKGMIILG